MNNSKRGRTGKPFIMSGGVNTSQIALARNSLPAQAKTAYQAIFGESLKYTPQEAAEALAIALSVCMQTLGEGEFRVKTLNKVTGEQRELIARVVDMSGLAEVPAGKRKGSSKH